MQYLSDETATKLHTDNQGIIWYAVGINPPASSNQSLDTFLLSHHLARLSVCVRILGIPQNAELISSLYRRKVRNELANICLAGPNICETPQELADPIATIMRMRDVFMSISCGGWHEMVESEYIIYALMAKQKTGDPDWFDGSSANLYAAHPLYKALDFVNGVSHRDTAELLMTIVDPRWYVDRRRPDNPAKLELYLGLTPKIQWQVSDMQKIPVTGRAARCAAVLRCWKTVPESSVNFDDPINFLWRAHRAAGGGAKGDLRASQLFVRYIRENWIDALTRRRGTYDKFFLLDRFFKTSEERAAFQSFMA